MWRQPARSCSSSRSAEASRFRSWKPSWKLHFETAQDAQYMSAVVLAQVSFFLGFASYKKFLGAYNTINGIGGVCCLTDAQYRGQHSKGASLHLRAGISWVLAE